MQLRTVDGKLTLGSVYKVIVWGWLVSWGIIFIPVFYIFTIFSIISGQVTFNGEMINGHAAVFAHLWPFLLLPPIVVVMHAFMFGGFITFGVWIYRHWRPLTVTAE